MKLVNCNICELIDFADDTAEVSWQEELVRA